MGISIAANPWRSSVEALSCSVTSCQPGSSILFCRLKAAIAAGLPDTVAGATINRFCASGLQTIVQGVHSVALGMNDVVLAGGSDNSSRVPMGGHNFSANRELMRDRPGSYHNMGQTAEAVARRYGISRADQDAFALNSHEKALAARAAGRFDSQVVPVPVRVQDEAGEWHERILERDEGPREGTNLEALAGLRTVFADDEAATVTAGNSSPLNDGAAMTVIMSAEDAAALGLRPLARLVQAAVIGVDPEVMGIGPVPAVRKLLAMTGMTVDEYKQMMIGGGRGIEGNRYKRQT